MADGRKNRGVRRAALKDAPWSDPPRGRLQRGRQRRTATGLDPDLVARSFTASAEHAQSLPPRSPSFAVSAPRLPENRTARASLLWTHVLQRKPADFVFAELRTLNEQAFQFSGCESRCQQFLEALTGTPFVGLPERLFLIRNR